MTNREIDALIAEHVMGVPMPPESEQPGRYSSCLAHNSKAWSWSWAGGGYPDKGEWIPAPFSSSPSASKRLRDRMRELGWYARLENTPHGKSIACMWRNGQVFTERCDTEEMAVALAALAALGVQVPA